MTLTRYGISRDDLASVLSDQPRFRLDQVWKGLFDELATPAEMTNLPKDLRARLDTDLPLALAPVTETTSDRGDTIKFLWRLTDGALVESVLMRYPGRITLCISSQAGCGMNCPFCATGQAAGRQAVVHRPSAHGNRRQVPPPPGHTPRHRRRLGLGPGA